MDLAEMMIENIILWVLIVAGDAFVFTVFYHRMMGRWWWTKKKAPKDWEITLSSDGWSLSGKDKNPLVTFAKMIAELKGTIKEVNQVVEASEQEQGKE